MNCKIFVNPDSTVGNVLKGDQVQVRRYHVFRGSELRRASAVYLQNDGGAPASHDYVGHPADIRQRVPILQVP